MPVIRGVDVINALAKVSQAYGLSIHTGDLMAIGRSFDGRDLVKLRPSDFDDAFERAEIKTPRGFAIAVHRQLQRWAEIEAKP